MRFDKYLEEFLGREGNSDSVVNLLGEWAEADKARVAAVLGDALKAYVAGPRIMPIEGWADATSQSNLVFFPIRSLSI
ncbi:MAG: hypothetical protein ABJN69_14455 [Hellea sp.]